jgi:phosphatidylserine decarboxylase
MSHRTWRAGRPYIVPPLAAGLVLAAARRIGAATAVLTGTAALAAFLRDPERACPAEAGVVYAAASGTVTNVGHDDSLRWNRELGSLRIGVFLSLLDVHVVRLPVAGIVVRLEDVAGQYKPAWPARAAETNRRVRLLIDTPDGMVGVVWTSGLVARRVVPWIEEGATVTAGERGGVIVFGSRSELVLPDAFEPLVAKGAKVTAGVTPVARAG